MYLFSCVISKTVQNENERLSAYTHSLEIQWIRNDKNGADKLAKMSLIRKIKANPTVLDMQTG